MFATCATTPRIGAALKRRLCALSAPLSFYVLASGCSAVQPPAGLISEAELDVRAAAEARAAELASMDLQGAREKLEAARKAMDEKKYDEARRLAESAQVQAQLAAAKSEAELSRRAAEDLRRRLRPESQRIESPQPPAATEK